MKDSTLSLVEAQLLRDELSFGLSLNTTVLCIGLRLSALTQVLSAVYTMFRLYTLWMSRIEFNRACRKYNNERRWNSD